MCWVTGQDVACSQPHDMRPPTDQCHVHRLHSFPFPGLSPAFCSRLFDAGGQKWSYPWLKIPHLPKQRYFGPESSPKQVVMTVLDL